MQERPILFSGEMVKAILAGRKTQTRRVIKPQSLLDTHTRVTACYKCPYGQPGDRLWVRETWGFSAKLPASTKDEMSWLAYPDLRGYRADGHTGYCWRPSIHMPRWASRLMLRIADVRVERLQEISETDAMAEGVIAWHGTKDGTVYQPEFKMLWDKINAKRGYSWDSNPWVWVIEFRRKI